MKDIKPYKNSNKNKKEQVALMFDNIAFRYDFLNRFLSLSIDKIWRRQAIRFLIPSSPQKILDIAVGTADFAIETVKIIKPKSIIGIDISEKMLAVGKKKIIKKKLENIIKLQTGDAENIKFADNYFDAVTVAFGVRNFENIEKGLSEMYRVLKKQGELVILEFSKPRKFPVKNIYNLITSISGVGFIVAAYFISTTSCFTKFKNGRKYACYCGTAPFEYSSGTSIHFKTRVNPMANKKMKSLLNMSARSAITCDPELKEYYHRKVEQGKNKMSTLNIIRNKIIHRVFAVVNRGTPYVVLQNHLS